MATLPGPYNMEKTGIVIAPDGTAVPKTVTTDFYAELDREFGGFAGHLLVSRHEFSEPWGMWEVHPAGDEVIHLLSGDVEFVLRTADGDRTVRLDRPGACLIVPRGVWHTARPLAPTALLFLTPGEGTEGAERPPGP